MFDETFGGRFHLECCLVGLNLEKHVALVDLIADIDYATDYGAFFHSLAKLR